MVKKALSLTGWQIIYCPFQFLAVVGGESAQAELASTEVVKERHQFKKNVFFWALPESPKPPPHDPNSGNLVLFFRTSKTTF